MDSVAPLPTGGGVTVIAEHRGRRDQDGQPEAENRGESTANGPPQAGETAPPAHHEPPPPVTEEELVPAETLFAATLMANSMSPAEGATEALLRRTERVWTPPESQLRLKDRLI
jgi:hypothetical protein